MFLKRTTYEGVTRASIYIGSIITVYSRQLKIVDYGDVFTRQKFESQKQRTFAMIKPDVYTSTGKIVDAILKEGFMISKLKMSRFNPSSVEQFYGEHKGKPFYGNLTQFMQSDVVTGMELLCEGAIQKWRNFIGPTNTQKAQEERPESIRARFGTDGTRNACHGSDSVQSAKREIDIFFENSRTMPVTAIGNNCTCVVIKPHILAEGKAGEVIDAILQEGFEISAM
jgi:nucleoside-diphosphate kinase